jgi:hypothetical protein
MHNTSWIQGTVIFLCRLYSSGVFSDKFEQFAASELRLKPVYESLLQVKVTKIDQVLSFPSPQDHAQVKSAEKRLLLHRGFERTEY